MHRALLGTAQRVNRYYDPLIERAMRRLAASGVEVWTREIAERGSRIPLEEMPRFYPEVIRPGRFEGMLMMGASLEEGRAMFGVFTDGPEKTALGDEADAVFRLLLPAFRAGSRAHVLSVHRWRPLAASLDGLEQAAAVYRGGVERYRTRALRRLMAADERREALGAGIAQCAGKLARASRDTRPSATLRWRWSHRTTATVSPPATWTEARTGNRSR